MFCPDCGAADQIANGYCKRCGEWLADPNNPRRLATGDPLGRLTTMLAFNGISALMAATSAIILLATYLGSADARWSIYVAAAMCAIISVHQTFSFFFTLEFRQTIKSRRDKRNDTTELNDYVQPASLGAGRTTEFVRPASVTEHTTELLEPVPRIGRQKD